jgi:hypothetical protein
MDVSGVGKRIRSGKREKRNEHLKCCNRQLLSVLCEIALRLQGDNRGDELVLRKMRGGTLLQHVLVRNVRVGSRGVHGTLNATPPKISPLPSLIPQYIRGGQ